MMQPNTRLRGDHQLWLTRSQLAALGFLSASMSVLTFFIGMQVGRAQVPAAAPVVVDQSLTAEALERDTLTELLARVERAAAQQLAPAEAGQITFPEQLTTPVAEVEIPTATPAEAPPEVEVPPEPGPAPEIQASGDAVPGAGWAVQLYAFPTEEEAEARVAALREAGHPAFRVAALVKGSTWHRVRVGPYPDETAARAAATELGTTLGIADPLVAPVP